MPRAGSVKFVVGGAIACISCLCLLVVLAPGWLEQRDSLPDSRSESESKDEQSRRTPAIPSSQASQEEKREAPSPGIPGGLLEQGILAYEAKDIAKLAESLAKMRESGPDLHIQLLQGMTLVLQGQPDLALPMFHAAAADPTIKGRALFAAGEVFYRKQDFVTASGVLQAAAQADPSLAGPHRLLAVWYYDTGAMDNALWHLDQVTQLAPEDARPWRLRGLILHDFERHAEAITAYEEALSRDLKPKVTEEVRLELAASLNATRQPAKALEQLDLCSPTTESKSLKANCLLSLGEFEQAETLLQEVLGESPEHKQTLLLKATLARELGDKQLAIDTLRDAVTAHPYEFDLRFQLMSALNAAGETEAAKVQQAEMEKLRALRDRFTELHHQSMEDPNSAELRVELGETAQKLGKWELAASWYQAALALDSDNKSAQEALRQLNQLSQSSMGR